MVPGNSKMQIEGNIIKMRAELGDPVQYYLSFSNEEVHMNELIGKNLKFEFEGQINDIVTGELTKKSYGQGYSYKSFITLAQCDMCIVKPETCHFAEGTCREPDWAEKHCFIPHIIYLANTSKPKIGITRETQIPTRWIDQGAFEALPILKVNDRKTSGEFEVEIAKSIADKTNWRDMLKGVKKEVDLEELREDLFEEFADVLDTFDVEEIESDVVQINYPVEEYPEKIISIGFDKMPVIEDKLIGIRGQYLILENAVLNILKHNGYHIKLSVS